MTPASERHAEHHVPAVECSSTTASPVPQHPGHLDTHVTMTEIYCLQHYSSTYVLHVIKHKPDSTQHDKKVNLLQPQILGLHYSQTPVHEFSGAPDMPLRLNNRAPRLPGVDAAQHLSTFTCFANHPMGMQCIQGVGMASK